MVMLIVGNSATRRHCTRHLWWNSTSINCQILEHILWEHYAAVQNIYPLFVLLLFHIHIGDILYQYD